MAGNDAAARKAAFSRSVKSRMKQIDEELSGKYSEQIETLLGISREEIDAITPDGTDIKVYAQLIEVVKEASRKNIAIADLRQTIRSLGAVAVEIAKKIPGFVV